MLDILKKTLGVCLIGFGVGMLLVILLPLTGWLFLIGAVVILVGLMWLFGWLRKGRWRYMKIVVKKVPKFLRGFVKLVFGIKENT